MARTVLIVEHPDDVTGIEWIRSLTPEMFLADESEAWRIVEVGRADIESENSN